MPSIEQMSKGSLAGALYKSLRNTRYEIDRDHASILARFHDDPKWIPALQKMIDGKFKGSHKDKSNG